MQLLHIDSSALGSHSVSRQLSADIVAELRRHAPGLDLTYRDAAARRLQRGDLVLVADRHTLGAHELHVRDADGQGRLIHPAALAAGICRHQRARCRTFSPRGVRA